MRIAGLVLAGGRSSRFGSEKAMARLEGRPLVAHAAHALQGGCQALAMNAPAGCAAAAWARTEALPLLSDPPDAPDGPLTGVLEGLRWARALGCDALATSPCDTPWLPLDLVATLADALGEAPAAFAATPSGSHPLCTVWRVGLEGALAEVLSSGHPSVRAWLTGIGAAQATFADASAFANVNTVQDLRGG